MATPLKYLITMTTRMPAQCRVTSPTCGQIPMAVQGVKLSLACTPRYASTLSLLCLSSRTNTQKTMQVPLNNQDHLLLQEVISLGVYHQRHSRLLDG